MYPMRIYIAGPYCPKNCSLHEAPAVAQRNVDRAIEVAMALIEKGHYPFVPHLSHYLNIHYSRKKELTSDFYYKYDITFLEHWAEAIFFIEQSPGADFELRVAIGRKLPVYTKLEEVPNALL
jgi:hypothetical protein